MADVLAMWTTAAHQGLAQAQFNLGAIYHHGQGVKRDFDEAAKWYRLAAHQGMIEAQVNLGSMYDHGQGVKQNFKEAAKYYRKAAG
jgi:TPR repeat protein